MAESNTTIEKRNEFTAKQKRLAEIFDAANDNGTYNFGIKKVQEMLGASDTADAVHKVKALNVELDAIGAELRQSELKEIADARVQRDAERSTPSRGVFHPPAPEATALKSLGQLFIESKAWDAYRKERRRDLPAELDISLKTLFETTAGFAPESVRSGLIVEAATRPIDVLDLIPSSPINQAAEVYMEETTRTHAAAEKAEGIAYAESTFEYTQRTSTVQKITDSIPVTDEQLEDASQVSSILDQRLRFGLRQRLDGQVLVGDGSAPNLRGFLDSGFITQTQAKGNDPVMDAVYKGITKVRFTGRANPNAVIMHPNDWQDVRLSRTADGQYLFGPPSQPGAATLWGLPVALSTACTENSAIVGDFANFCRIGERRGVMVEVGYVGDQFKEGKSTLRASLRACFTVYRIDAFCIVTGV